MMSFTKSYDRWIGLTLLVLVAFLFADTFNFKTRPYVPLNTAFWPRVVLAGIALVAVYLTIRGRVSDEEPERFSNKAAYAFLAAVFYVIALPLGGFFAMSSFVGAVGYFWLANDNSARTVAISIVYGILVSGAVYLLFKHALLVQLPMFGGF
ncbi:MAG: hypothetical protein GKR97_20780 [Rhizobiaceae bacterium]|nr:hypothetical protein [Rhizobiaceae bacterium]